MYRVNGKISFLVEEVSWTPKMRQLAKVEPCP
jgi:hypothetical protein